MVTAHDKEFDNVMGLPSVHQRKHLIVKASNVARIFHSEEPQPSSSRSTTQVDCYLASAPRKMETYSTPSLMALVNLV